MEPAPFDIRECLSDTLATFTDPARQKNIHLSSFVDPSVPNIIIQDKSRVRQVLFNLLGMLFFSLHLSPFLFSLYFARFSLLFLVSFFRSYFFRFFLHFCFFCLTRMCRKCSEVHRRVRARGGVVGSGQDFRE